MTPVRTLGVVTAMLALAMLCTASLARAATPYEAQLGGRVYAILSTLIIGEFGGRTRANNDSDALKRRICQPSDYDELREAAKDNATMIAFHRRCRLVEGKIDSTHFHHISYLPVGYCETLKSAFEAMLAAHVYPVPIDSRDGLIFVYKGLRLALGTGDRELLRGAGLEAKCRDDGALQVSAPLKRP